MAATTIQYEHEQAFAHPKYACTAGYEGNFKWTKHKVKALGVWLTAEPEATVNLNYNEKLEKVRTTLNSSKYRRLTLIGKIAVLKSLAVSLSLLISYRPCV